MPLWIWVVLILLLMLSWVTFFKAEIIIEIIEDGNTRGLHMAFNSRLLRLKSHYNYTDTRFNLLESILITLYESRFEKSRHEHNELDYSAILKLFIRNLPMRSIINFSLQSLNLFKWVLHFTSIQKLEWHTSIGTGQADRTAIGTGFGWALKGVLIGQLNSYCRFEQLDINVNPDFVHQILKSRLVCIFKIRTVHIIYIQLYAIAMKVRWYVNGFTARIGQSPHRRINEDCHAEY
jgi:hypothetical protein